MRIEPLTSRSLYPGMKTCMVCGSTIVAALRSEYYVQQRLIHHFWHCDDCADASETFVQVSTSTFIQSDCR